MAQKKNYAEMDLELKKGISMPGVGLGAFKLTNHDLLYRTLDLALNAGFRRTDVGSFFGKEKISGKAEQVNQKSGVTWQELFNTTKLSTLCSGGKFITKAFERSLQNLERDYIDMHLIHFLGPPYSYRKVTQYTSVKTETWMAIAKIYDESKVRALDVSNFTIRHLVQFTQVMAIGPMVNQDYWKPYSYQPELMMYCCEYNIKIQGLSAFTGTSPARNVLMEDSIINGIAARYNATTAQVLLLWALQRGIVIPKSKEVFQVDENRKLHFRLADKEMFLLDFLSEKEQKYFWAGTNVA